MKLVKVQRQILENAIESERRSGSKKPITVAAANQTMDYVEVNYSKSYAKYCKAMDVLLQEGIISRGNMLTLAYVVDLDVAQSFLENNN